MMIYQVEINGVVTIIEADTPEQARSQAIENFIGRVVVKKADEDEIAWFNAMSGKE